MLPDPPCEGKMIRAGVDLDHFAAYRPTSIETRYKFPIRDETFDGGLNYNLVDILSWESPWTRLEATMPPSKKVKHSDTDSNTNASVSSFYQHYLDVHKTEISGNSITASKYGKVAASDLTLPFEQQLKCVPKEFVPALFDRDAISSATTAASVPNASAVPWLKRTEYISAREESSRRSSAQVHIPESLEQLETFESNNIPYLANGGHINTDMGDDDLVLLSTSPSRRHHGDINISNKHTTPPSDKSKKQGSGLDMDIDNPEIAAMRDEADELLDSIEASLERSSQMEGGRSSKDRTDQASKSRSSVTKSSTLGFAPVADLKTKVKLIKDSFDDCACRTAIVPPKSGHLARSSSHLKHSSSSKSTSSSTLTSDVHIVEEWDIFPEDLVWANEYLAVTADTAHLPKSTNDTNAVILPLSTHEHTLLKTSTTSSELKSAHEAHEPNSAHKNPEVVALFTDTYDSHSSGSEENGSKPSSSTLQFVSVFEAMVTSLRPTFDSSGSYIISLGQTTPYDEIEDEDNGFNFEADSLDKTRAVRAKKVSALQKASVGQAHYKDLDAKLHLKTASSLVRKVASTIKRADKLMVKATEIPEVEQYMRDRAVQDINTD